ncbi:MAG: triose-phosphate isomerase [Actinomycetota bacterium]
MSPSARRPIIAANWKMNKTHLEAMHFVESLRNILEPGDYERAEVVICPPFTALRTVQTAIEGAAMPAGLGAQNMYWAESGAFTGEISPGMLSKLGVSFVILGHSERRELFGETDEGVNRKLKAAFDHGLTPIMCVGETLAEREAGQTQAKVERQVRVGIAGIAKEAVATLVIAYEPIWAIGTGRNAYPDDAQATISLIRSVVASVAGEAAESVRIQYGGSVKGGNCDDFMCQPDIDGALVGGASLDPEEFARIVRYQTP